MSDDVLHRLASDLNRQIDVLNRQANTALIQHQTINAQTEVLREIREELKHFRKEHFEHDRGTSGDHDSHGRTLKTINEAVGGARAAVEDAAEEAGEARKDITDKIALLSQKELDQEGLTVRSNIHFDAKTVIKVVGLVALWLLTLLRHEITDAIAGPSPPSGAVIATPDGGAHLTPRR